MDGGKTKRMKRLFTGSLIALAAVTACCAERHPAEAYEALASLRKVQAATHVGVNYQQYGQLLIEARDKTNAASRVLLDGSPLKAEIQAAIDAYVDAGKAWGEKFSEGGYECEKGSEGRPEGLPHVRPVCGQLRQDKEPGSTLIPKYSLATENWYGMELADSDKAMQTIWMNADLHLNKLAELLPKS